MKRIINLTACIVLLLCCTIYCHAQPGADLSLINAVKHNNTAAVEKLISQGASINAVDSNLATPLMWAAYTGNLSLFKYLVQKGANYKKKGVVYLDSTHTGYYGNIIGIAAAKNDTLLLVYCLDSLHLPVDDKEYNGETKAEDGWSPLFWAASKGNLESVHILVEHYADINEIYIKTGNTPLLNATQADQAGIIIYLINQNNINLKARNKQGWQVLHYICMYYNNPELIKKIIEKGVDVNTPTTMGLTPLMLAAFRGDYETLFALLDLNADDTISDINHKTAYNYAFANNKYESALYIKKWKNGYTKKQIQELRDSVEITNRLHSSGDSCIKHQQYYCAIESRNAELNYNKLIYGEIHPNYAMCLNNLAFLYQTLGMNYKALPLYQHSLQIYKEAWGDNKHPDHITISNNLVALYTSMGNYDKALALGEQVRQTKEEVSGKKDSAYARILNNLAQLYYNIGSKEKAMSLFQQARLIFKEVLGEKHLYYAISLNNIAIIEEEMRNYDKAIPLLQEALNIVKDALGDKDPFYATALNNLALAYKTIGNYDQALTLYQNTLQILKEVFGEKHAAYATCLSNLAGLYEMKGKYEKAVSSYQQAMEIFKEVLGEKHPSYANSLMSLARIYYENNKILNANESLEAGILLISENLRNGSKFLSQSDMMHFITNNYYNFDISNSIALTTHDKPLFGLGLQTELIFKGIILQNNKDLYSLFNLNSNNRLKELIDQFTAARNQLAFLYQENASSKKIDSVLTIFDRYEQQLIQLSPQYQQMIKNRNVQWQQVQQKLKPNEAVLEFVQFNFWNKKWTDTTMYAVFVLLPKGQPQMVGLCNKKILEQRINDTLDKNELYVKQLYEVTDRGIKISNNQIDTVPGLYRLLWLPLDSLLTGINTIYYAPSGLLHRINFAAINYSGKKVLGDKYSFHLMGSTRDLLSYKSDHIEARNDTLLLYGGIDFDVDSSSLARQRKKYYSTPTINDGTGMRSGNSTAWAPLEGSAEELASIQTLTISQKIPTHSFTQKEASEESFIFYTHQSRSPALIHIASHGFFYPDEQRRKLKEEGKDAPYFMSSANVFQRSGLVFAGANHISSGKSPIQGIEDGIVTAYDISNADLQNTKLMVLSACETGLGKIENTEGVFGLQRAVRMAGCKNLLMSLWKIPDEQTARFMDYFYKQLLQEKKNIYESFQFAQKQMRELYSGQPYFWAGFVLME
jgi:CHAT domain-containing protein/ankyrin repeat protein